MKPRSKLFVTGLLLALLALSITAISAQTQTHPASDMDAYPPPNPNTIYVDQSFLGTELGTVNAPYRTVAAGINAVQNDGLVLVGLILLVRSEAGVVVPFLAKCDDCVSDTAYGEGNGCSYEYRTDCQFFHGFFLLDCPECLVNTL